MRLSLLVCVCDTENLHVHRCVWACVRACIFSSTPVAHAEHEMAYLLGGTRGRCLLCALHVFGSRASRSANRAQLSNS